MSQRKPVAPPPAPLPARVLVTKIGFDGHDRGSRIVAAFLRDAGMEVIYTPPWQEIDSVVETAIEEEDDVNCISSLATDHLIVPQLMEALSASGIGHVAVVVGGIVPGSEVAMLEKAGVARIFHPGEAREAIVETVAALALAARACGEAE